MKDSTSGLVQRAAAAVSLAQHLTTATTTRPGWPPGT